MITKEPTTGSQWAAIEHRLEEIAQRVGLIWDALKGSELGGQGLIARVDNHEDRLRLFERERTLALGALWAGRVLWTALGGGLVFCLNHLLK